MDSRMRLDRRKFITLSASVAMTAFVSGCSKKRTVADVPEPLSNASVHREGAGTTSKGFDGGAPPKTCVPTSGDIIGPFWRKGVPIRNDFDLFDDDGQKLTLTGRVVDEACQPVPQAVVEMWHASPTILAVDQLSNGDAVGYDISSPAFKYYGQFATDADGGYEMFTKKPGWYLNGSTFRPSHIHVKVYVDGVERLTTQLYFAGDPFIPKDPWAARAAERIVHTESAVGGGLLGRFDFAVAAA